jgi:osmotically-inducible protein OsmY
MFSKIHFTKLAVTIVLVASLAACAAVAERETPGEYLDDAAITTKVIAAIVQDPVLEKNQVNVETFHNVVQLSGFVDSNQSLLRAGEVARGIKGVRSVQNNLIVHTPK